MSMWQTEARNTAETSAIPFCLQAASNAIQTLKVVGSSAMMDDLRMPSSNFVNPIFCLSIADRKTKAAAKEAWRCYGRSALGIFEMRENGGLWFSHALFFSLRSKDKVICRFFFLFFFKKIKAAFYERLLVVMVKRAGFTRRIRTSGIAFYPPKNVGEAVKVFLCNFRFGHVLFSPRAFGLGPGRQF